MVWKIRFTKQADKALRKLDKAIAGRIIDLLEEVSHLDDPHVRGKGLTGNLAGLWRYRVGDYRVVCSIEANELVILVVDLGHRHQIYK